MVLATVLVLLVLSGCKRDKEDLDFELVTKSRSTIALKSLEGQALSDCAVFLNGINGFWHKPGNINFGKGEQRVLVLSNFFSPVKRQFDPKINRIEEISINCSKPRGKAILFNSRTGFGNFLG
ncbi:hypothetical protein O4H49_17220 [Kiloniella laminariae]|uniref:Lipoprotein n=1 Tax=Kiloniella laminariae TaxID=454162 RepID=A0ABT4LN29_9PROT|nr:hypothetical protein [Kiloniella laminariae]MCZ4282532.1 hypothetical protein [Kiloniella laminariae]